MLLGTDRQRQLFSLAVGLMDTVTGILLMLIPATTIHLFGAEMPAGDDVTMRLVGAFVCGVGLSYFTPMLPGTPETRRIRLAAVWMATGLIRGMVAICVLTAMSAGRLDAYWIVVGGSDAAIAILQLLIVFRKASP